MVITSFKAQTAIKHVKLFAKIVVTEVIGQGNELRKSVKNVVAKEISQGNELILSEIGEGNELRKLRFG